MIEYETATTGWWLFKEAMREGEVEAEDRVDIEARLSEVLALVHLSDDWR